MIVAQEKCIGYSYANQGCSKSKAWILGHPFLLELQVVLTELIVGINYVGSGKKN
jgi:hypothetical protein